MRKNKREPASFRDPSGYIFWKDNQLYRQINLRYQSEYDLLMKSGLYQRLVDQGLLIPHQKVNVEPYDGDEAYLVIRPQQIPFISYPYEWSFSQLQDAALCTLRIQKHALDYGMSLKDSSGYNIQFWKGKPVLIDTLSFEILEELYENKRSVTGVPTGFTDLDRMTSGLQKSDLIIIAGRPSMGKTSFMLNIAENVAIDYKIPVGVFSLEMSKEQIVQRFLCSRARVPAQRLRTGYLKESEWPLLTQSAARLSEAPIFVDDTPAMGLTEMRAKARRLKSRHGLGLICVDYLQLAHGLTGVESRQQEISQISQGLKALAKELNIPVLAGSQLSRAVEARENKRPILSDLRESGAIEQDADIVGFIYREEMYKPDKEEAKGLAEVIIGKHRNGPTGTVRLAFLNEFTRFETLAPMGDEYYQGGG